MLQNYKNYYADINHIIIIEVLIFIMSYFGKGIKSTKRLTNTADRKGTSTATINVQKTYSA
jgi:hypothetical protein